MFLRLLGIVLLVFPFASPASGKSLGVHGTLYEIQEEDTVDYLKRRMKGFQEDGTIARKQKEAQDIVKKRVFFPEPIAGISTATENKTFWHDPTVITDKPITDGKGRILFPAGTKVNPLAYSGVSSRYIFIDGRDQSQVEFALSKRQNVKDRIVLTAGSWVALAKKVGFAIYYDQTGYLTKHFNIKHVPAVLSQDGLKMKIEEFAL
ncbi:MAG: type-F conjugative transfer system protein TraW [Methylococcaceae bacterium]